MGTTLAEKQPLGDMTVYEIVIELRDTRNPSTNKEHHSLTEIAKIAGAPPGWTYHALRGPRGNNARSDKYLTPLRNYLKDRRNEQLFREEKASHVPRPPVKSSPERHIDPAITKEFGEIRRMEIHKSSTPNGSGTIEKRGTQMVQTAGNGARVVSNIPRGVAPTPAPVADVKITFMDRFEGMKKKLWTVTEEFDGLIADAPPLFKPGVTGMRDKLFTLLQEMEA